MVSGISVFRRPRPSGWIVGALPPVGWAIVVLGLILSSSSARGQGNEFRAFWVDAFHSGFMSSSQVTTLISNVRAANCNAVVVEVRKRGDAYYTPNTTYPDYEPHATGTSPATFDSLADLIAKAHDTSGGKRRVEVHAWLVTWPIWGSTTPPADPQHPYNRHPEWLTQDDTGATWNGNQYCFDPGHPGAFNHTYRIAINLVTNYSLDGVNFDYVRYAGNTWGYNPVAVSRFHALYGGSGNPSPTDAKWLQFRRDQVTALVRKVYLNTLAFKPNVKVSADTITWAPGPTSLSAWYSTSAAWNNVLQDWRGWMQEGILDLNIPMAYFNQAGAYTRDWTNWCNFIRDYQYNRQAAIGPGIYLNSAANALTQLRYARATSPAGHSAVGFCAYSYAVPNADGIGFGTFHTYLTNSPNVYDPGSPAVCAQPASVPVMPWKTSPVTGHLIGTVYAGSLTNPFDGAVVTLSGPAARSQTNDSSGFFGFVDLIPGTYSVRANLPGVGAVSNSVTIAAGAVTTCNLIYVPQPPVITAQPRSVAAVVGGTAAFSITASSSTPMSYQWRLNGTDLPGQTSAGLSLTNLQAADFGSYSALVRNTNGATASAPAALTVAVQPTLTFSGTRPDLTLTFMSEWGPNYLLEYKDRLADAQWQVLTNLTGTGATLQAVDYSPGADTRFYRVRVR